jgi:hypothetical protein
MAAKKQSSGNSLDDLIADEFAEMRDLSKEDDSVSDFLTTGNYALNYICSKNLKGAIPMHRISSLFGRSQTGKSLLIANINKDPRIKRTIIFESEGGGNCRSLFEFVKSPYEKVRIVPIQTFTSYKIAKKDGTITEISEKELPASLESDTFFYKRGLISMLKGILNKLIYNHNEEEILLAIDSLGNIKSVRQLAGGYDMGMTGQNLNDLFSSIDSLLEEAHCTLVFTNKVYNSMDEYTGFIQKGGDSVIYNPSLSIELTNLAMNDTNAVELSGKEVDDEKLSRKSAIGTCLSVVRARVTKSRFGTTNKNATYLMDADFGIVRNSGLFEMLKDYGLCVKNGSMYSIPALWDKSFYKKDFLKLFEEKEEENVEKLQKALEKREEELKKIRQNLDVNDINEALSDNGVDTGDEEIELSSMIKQMEIDKENA